MNCPDCDASVHRGKCTKCGWKEGERQGLPEWRGLPKYVKPHDDDVCGEWLDNGTLCQKTVREHISEFRALTQREGTIFTRPSKIGPEALDDAALEQRRQMLLQRAEEAMKLLKNFPPAAGAP